MFYSVAQAENLCDSDPSLIFSLIKEDDMEVVSRIISKENYDFNIIDSDGNNVLMFLLKVTFFNAWQPLNAYVPIVLTVSGITTEVIFSQKSIESEPITVTGFPLYVLGITRPPVTLSSQATTE